MITNRIKALELKARCLNLMDEVAATGERLVITKNGTWVATPVPCGEKRDTVAGTQRLHAGGVLSRRGSTTEKR